MIRINLLPEKEGARPTAKARVVPEEQVSPLTYLIIAAVVIVLGSYYYFFIHVRVNAMKSKDLDKQGQVDRTKRAIQKFGGNVDELKVAESISKSMLDVVYALDAPDRMLWSEKLNQISDLVPENVFLKRLTVSEQVNKVETADSRQRRKQFAEQQGAKAKPKRRGAAETGPAAIYYPEITQELRIFGIAYSENEAERIRLINEFHDNLMSGANTPVKIKSDFMKGFIGEIVYGDVNPNVLGGRAVAEFSFTLKTKASGPKTLTPPAAEKAGKKGAVEPEKASAPEKEKSAAKGKRRATDAE